MTSPHLAGKATILIVEDEPLVLMSAVDIISDAGFKVVEASNADEAISILEAGCDIWIVFYGHKHAGLDERLAAVVRVRWPPIEIIVTSGHYRIPDSDLPDRGVFLPKPYDHSQVIETLQRMVLH